MKIFLTIQNNTHQDHLEGRFPELKFFVDGTKRKPTAGELKHGFHVRPKDVDFVANCVNPFGIEGVLNDGFTLDGFFDGPINLTIGDVRQSGFHVPAQYAPAWELAVGLDVEQCARNLRLIYAKGNPCN